MCGGCYGLRVREISGIAVCKKIVQLPSPIPQLAGIASVKGVIHPVISLESVLGFSQFKLTGWVATCGVTDPIALTIGKFEKYLQVAPSDMHVPQTGATGYIVRVARVENMVVSVIGIDSIIEAIKGKT
jgi:chemotaxis signal transduction protein